MSPRSSLKLTSNGRWYSPNIMTPEEIFSTYGVDVTKLSAPYSSYHLATSEDLWLCDVGAPSTKLDDLIIETPDDYRSNIYAYKIPSRHANLTGPDFYYYIYHPAYMLGTLKECATIYLDRWINRNTKGTLTFRLSEKEGTLQIYISNSVVAVKEDGNEYITADFDTVFTKWGARFVVQNYVDSPTPGLINCCFVGDLPNND